MDCRSAMVSSQVHWGLFGSVSTVQIGPNTNMVGVPCHLANVIDVITDAFDGKLKVLGATLFMHPVGHHHDSIKCHFGMAKNLA